ncbi:putative acetyltransferase [compost metagenome]
MGLLRVSEPEANHFQLEELYLLESCRGKGYGTSFLAWLEQELINRGGQTLALWVLQDNWGSVRFYERYGFEGIGEERMIERGQTFKQIKYAKQLSIIA